jgi:Uma2 family endonuclease
MMKTLIESPPRTMMEVYKSLPEGTLVELIENRIYMSPAPSYNHQKILQYIFKKLDSLVTEAGKGDVLIAPFDVYLDESNNAVQPDIIVVLKENESIINKKGHIHGVPDMLIEILSEGNKDHDRIKKKNLYEAFGVREYWMVDPETKLATGFTLQQGRYQAIPEGSGRIASRLLDTEFLF